jgi:hypothetical protein
MQKRLAAAAAATTILAVTLTGCSQAQDAADKAKEKASEAAASKASEAADKLKDKATEVGGDQAGKLVNDVLDKLSPEEQQKLQGLESVALGKKGELVKDADSLTVAEFFGARQSAAATGGEELSALEAVSSQRVLKVATKYVVSKSGQDIPFIVNVVSSKGGTVEACVGPKGNIARAITVADGKVVKIAPGTQAC